MQIYFTESDKYFTPINELLYKFMDKKDEIQKNIVILKNMTTSNQLEVPISDLIKYFNN